MVDMQALAEKDPAFYKFLQDNDPELLNFDADGDAEMGAEDDSEEDSAEEEARGKKSKNGKGKEKARKNEHTLTKEMLRSWQKSILEVRSSPLFHSPARPRELTLSFSQTRSLRSFRKLLHAFRSAARSGIDRDDLPSTSDAAHAEHYEIHDPKLFRKVVLTTLKYTPVVLSSMVPFKEVNGKL